jgi:thiamine-monophosphate kinase
VVWLENPKQSMLIVLKSDMLVSSTDAPPQMLPSQIGAKSIVSCVSDFAAKGVKPVACLVSIAIPREKSNRKFLNGLTKGFKEACGDYGVRILGGDTGESKSEIIVDCSMMGFAENVIRRSTARAGELIGTTGCFGLQSSGLAILLDRKKLLSSPSKSFRSRAISAVLKPRAKLDLGLKISAYISSSIDSSDGLAMSLYQIAEASQVDLDLLSVPIAPGVEGFARLNGLSASDLALFGGEEFEIIFTFDRKYEKELRSLGTIIIGKALRNTPAYQHPKVYYNSRVLERRGYVHNKEAA